MDLPARLLGSNSQYSRYPLGEFVSAMGRLGFSRLDFVPQTPHIFCHDACLESPVRLRSILDRAGLTVRAVTPPPYRYSITAPQGVQQAATLAYYKNCITLARSLGSPYLVLGAAGACWDLPAEALTENAVRLLRSLAAEASAQSVTLLLCPVLGKNAPLLAQSPVLGTARECAALCDAVSSPHLQIAVDTHVISVNGETLSQWFQLLGPRISLVRLTDGNYHGYRPLGAGCLPTDRYLAELDALGYRGDLSLLLPGEGYLDAPSVPDQRSLEALGVFRREGFGDAIS
ncbi:MAG: sugar phosphate isomerase/epimerase family protein [Oscillospiraceae bacterium]